MHKRRGAQIQEINSIAEIWRNSMHMDRKPEIGSMHYKSWLIKLEISPIALHVVKDKSNHIRVLCLEERQMQW